LKNILSFPSSTTVTCGKVHSFEDKKSLFFDPCFEEQKGHRIKKKHVLVYLFSALSLVILCWLYLHLGNPTVHETFTLTASEEVTKELNLSSGEYVFIWLSTIPPGTSRRYAMGWVIKFFVVDLNNDKAFDNSGLQRLVWSTRYLL